MSDLRYVILHHTGVQEPHYDLMLEISPGSALATFRCPIWPPDKPAILYPLGDHRRDYLDYEGPVSGDRGEVRRVASGTYRTLARSEDNWRVLLDESIKLDLSRLPDDDRWSIERRY